MPEEDSTRELFLDFHRALAAATQNNLLVMLFDRFRDLMFFVMDDVAISHAEYQKMFQIAKKLVRQIDERDCLKAIATMKEYLDTVQPIYLGAEKE